MNMSTILSDFSLIEKNGSSANGRRIIYLACQYAHPDLSVRNERFRLATNTAAKIISQGYIVYSPITMTHPLDVVLAGHHNTLGSDYWVNFDEAFMDACSEMIVLQIEGWDESLGIKREIEYFKAQGKPIYYLPKEF